MFIVEQTVLTYCFKFNEFVELPIIIMKNVHDLILYYYISILCPCNNVNVISNLLMYLNQKILLFFIIFLICGLMVFDLII